MPLLLKLLTAHALSCIIFLIGSVAPHDSFSVNGHVVTYAEWWSSGAGVYASLVGIALPVCAWLLLKRARHVRAVYFSALSIGLISPYLLMEQLQNSGERYVLAAFGALIAVLIVWYLYAKKSVQSYFASNMALQPTARGIPGT